MCVIQSGALRCGSCTPRPEVQECATRGLDQACCGLADDFRFFHGTVDVGVRFKPWWISGFDPFMGLGSPFGHGDPDACEGTAVVLNQDAVVRDASPLDSQTVRAFEAVTSHDGAQRGIGQQELLRPVGLAVVIGLPVRPILYALAPYPDEAVVV